MPRTGRPPIDNPRTERLWIRLTPEEKAEIQANADMLKISVSEYVRGQLDLRPTGRRQ